MLRRCLSVLACMVALVQAAVSEEAPKGLVVSGLMEVYYAYNTNTPLTTTLVTPNFTFKVENDLHNFSFRHNRPRLSFAKVSVEQPTTAKGWGFRLDLTGGTTANWVHQSEPAGRSWAYVQQAFLSLPLGKGQLDVGKFVTHHGAEVIESQDNWNYSRSLLFSWAIPFYHAGIRYWLPLNDTDKMCLHLYQGWNVVEDNNGSKSAGLLWTRATEKFTLTFNYTVGAELPNSSRLRHLVDTVFVKPLSKRETVMLNADWARDNAASATWYGVAAYWRRQVGKEQFVTLRAEWFRDDDGFATGTRQTLKEITFTYEVPLRGLLGGLLRLEIRHDWSDKDVFDGGTKSSQPVFLIGLMRSF